ncbi:hypothetical protein C8F04DRAFT_1239424 [Mycena alexandri]|uniref:Uncharacterized protein n=1 Tax=Mycena alexandri TaxID=1745969 RepID=A0AAD6WXK3_9AGAR|nr:hypothetical protein C8F04DRAFT_1239424 [Mycena alexandri]
MPKIKNSSFRGARGPTGTFTSVPDVEESESDTDSDDSAWETDEELEKADGDYFEAWQSQPIPRIYEERLERNVEKREKAAAKRRAAEMRGAEHREGGAMDNQQEKGSL